MMYESKQDKLKRLLDEAKKAVAAKAALKDMGEHFKDYEDELEKKRESERKIEVIEAAQKVLAEVGEEPALMEWAPEQEKVFEIVESGESCCVIGKAGTGKTTVAKEAIRRLQRKGIIGPMRASTKWLQAGLPGIAVVSYTNRAVKNIARGMPEDVARHTVTVHKLLEFAPHFYEVPIPDKPGEVRTTVRFEPGRNAFNPLPSDLKVIVVEESSMIGTDLWMQLLDALPHNPQFIFLGDLQQLPPVFGPAILGFKLNELPVIELTQIFRQAAGSPIIQVAHKVSRGEMITPDQFEMINVASSGKLTIRPWKKRLDADGALHIMNLLFKDLTDKGQYDPMEDMVMIPFNKGMGTVEFNKNLADYLGKKRNAVVYEIIAGFNKHYYAVGDKILCDRQEAVIEEIRFNDNFKGRSPIPASDRLNRWGMYEIKEGEKKEEHTQTLDDVEELMLRALAGEKDEEAKQQASHVLICRLLGDDRILEVRTTGEYSATDFAYALTIHKCQGSEWRKCFLIIHNTHATMVSRELIYTAITRAREELIMLVEPDTFERAAKNQRIKGNTIKEKAEFFKGKKHPEKDD